MVPDLLDDITFDEDDTETVSMSDETEETSDDTDKDVDEDGQKSTEEDENQESSKDQSEKNDNKDVDSDENEKESDTSKDEQTDDGDDSDSDGDNDEEEDPLVVSLIADSGFEFEDEELEGIDETEEGLKQAVDLISNKKAKQEYENGISKYKDVEEYLNYRKNGGDPQEYFKLRQNEVDLESMELGEDDVMSQREIVKQTLNDQGYSKEDINEEIQELEEAGRLYDRANRNLNVLRKKSKKEKEQALEQQEQQKQQQLEERKEMISQAQSIVKNKELPVEADEQLVEYFFGEPDSEDPPQYMQDAQNLELKDMLTIASIVKNGVNLNNAVESKADKKAVENLRQRLKKQKSAGDYDTRDDTKDRSVEKEIDNIDFG